VPPLALGDPAPAYTLPGVDGREHSLSEWDGRPVAVVFSCVHCPYVVAWEERLNDIARDYEGRAGLVAINSNHHLGDSFEDMVRRAEEKGFVFPFLRDESQEVARAYGPARTPEVFLFDAEHRLVYHGAPDSDYTDARAPSRGSGRHSTRSWPGARPSPRRRRPSAAPSSGRRRQSPDAAARDV
jgi:peroxiredoxin